jgi:predicted short-subunit dehydrogenase-like oxidoreductase (DUF2520 family)
VPLRLIKMKKTSPKITLIGAGNVATQLGLALHREGYFISQVYSKTAVSASSLAKKIRSETISDLKKLKTDSSIYIIAVKDDVIADLAKQLKLKDQIIVHTSGSIPMKVLKGASKNIGVLYPLQTFTKNKNVNFREIPVCIEGNNSSTTKTLEYFAKSISSNVKKVNSEERKTIHLAAIFACNFSNHMYAIADEILNKNKLSLDLLKPLIEETADKIKNNSPVKVQTGPAIRGDKKVMEEHLKMLKGNKKLKEIYEAMSQSIIRTKNQTENL